MEATTIAADDFLTTGTAGFYSATSVNGQTATNGTTGYYTGSTTATQTAGWASGTGAFVAQTGGLTNPNVVNPPTSNDGSLTIVGNSNTRSQYRDLASTSPIASSDYYFSLLCPESANSCLGTALCRGGSHNPISPERLLQPPSRVLASDFPMGLSLSFASTGGDESDQRNHSLAEAPSASQTYMDLKASPGDHQFIDRDTNPLRL